MRRRVISNIVVTFAVCVYVDYCRPCRLWHIDFNICRGNRCNVFRICAVCCVRECLGACRRFCRYVYRNISGRNVSDICRIFAVLCKFKSLGACRLFRWYVYIDIYRADVLHVLSGRTVCRDINVLASCLLYVNGYSCFCVRCHIVLSCAILIDIYFFCTYRNDTAAPAATTAATL